MLVSTCSLQRTASPSLQRLGSARFLPLSPSGRFKRWGERGKERRGKILEFGNLRQLILAREPQPFLSLAPPEVIICRSFSWPLREVIQGGLAARREGPRAVCQNARQGVVSHHAGTVLLVCLPKVKDSARMDTHQHARRGNAPGEAARRPPIGPPVRLRYVCAASALESTGLAVGAGSRRSSAKFRADLLQDPEKSQDNTVVDASKRLFAGGVAGAIAKTAIAPLDRVKIIFQTHPAKRFSLRNVVLELTGIHAREGVKGLWRGNAATVLRVFPYAGIQFAAFDIYKRPLGKASSAQKVLAELVGLSEELAEQPVKTKNRAFTMEMCVPHACDTSGSTKPIFRFSFLCHTPETQILRHTPVT